MARTLVRMSTKHHMTYNKFQVHRSQVRVRVHQFSIWAFQRSITPTTTFYLLGRTLLPYKSVHLFDCFTCNHLRAAYITFNYPRTEHLYSHAFLHYMRFSSAYSIVTTVPNRSCPPTYRINYSPHTLH